MDQVQLKLICRQWRLYLCKCKLNLKKKTIKNYYSIAFKFSSLKNYKCKEAYTVDVSISIAIFKFPAW